ncbi:uncharacterized protein EDB91DRAFT_1255563 [Suillus paluster]|uniref:uncharacterized protein n=1 Tax=Suillus paluster TaxID=48578 RepID=UPI001B87BDD2|nr:uncharacterized protein EDB91DRAFT_1255563 [Suillus paluster]KAG1723666.1 hypothetical protein EDB91DRAFT_1255563 [Suillus paluster]
MSENTTAIAASSAPLHISSIIIRPDDASKKKVEFVELELDSRRREIRRGSGKDKDLSAKFDPAIAVSTERVSLIVHCQHHAVRKTIVEFSLDGKDILSDAVDQDGKREYRTTQRKITIIITISRLQPTSNSILQICPRFRLLVIGKTGVGKSSLIHQAFKINGVHVSEHTRGKTDIDKEFIAPENGRFVLHDSEGFEGGDSASFSDAKEFIARRRKMPELKDKIHAVWLCLSIPHANGRLVESAVEEFLTSRKEILGDIPIIVVFTKQDLLVNTLKLNAMKSGGWDAAALDQLKRDSLNNLCVQPLEREVGSDILHATISTKNEYENTIRELVELTTTNVEKFEASLTMMIAQRVDIGLKVKASIAIGKKRYWRGLGSSMDFAGFTMQDCLSVIHKDVIDVWNFNDPCCHLADEKFRAQILNDLDNTDLPNLAQAVQFGLSVVGEILKLPLAGPILPIVASIAAGVVVVKWVYDTYQRTDIVLRRIMTYIVDLTCIMQILFLLAPTGPISRRAIKAAIKTYGVTGKSGVHLKIKSWHMPLIPSGRDDALEKIVGLIEDHSIKADEVEDLRTQIQQQMMGLQLDEEW